MMRQTSSIDQFIQHVDRAFGFLSQQKSSAMRENPAHALAEPELSPAEIKHTIGLMRVNHAGEVAAQGLYQGQALTAHDAETAEHMQQAAQEEIDHLAWCQERLTELGGRSSYLDPLWYLGALCIGATAGLIGDKWSLGFIAETENQVSEHLQNHLGLLPTQDKKSEHILVAMKTDEERHATHAIETGGAPLPALVKFFMRLSAKVMVKTAYYF